MKRNKLYVRREPDKEGKLYFMFCEGEKRETTYFNFFNQFSSQIIQIVPHADGKNSPMGLYKNACQSLLANKENPDPSYLLNNEDEVWFIIDTDKWGKEIETLRSEIAANHKNWFVGQSNPSFEVWLYYHFEKEKPKAVIANWKTFINEVIKGGFNTSKHPACIQTAIVNSEANFSSSNDQPDLNTTQVYILAKKILPLVKAGIDAKLSDETHFPCKGSEGVGGQ